MAVHSSVLAWRFPWTEEPGGLQSTGSERVGHNWAEAIKIIDVLTCTLLAAFQAASMIPASFVGEKRESVVAQSCPTLCDPMDWSLGLWPASFLCPWDSLGKNTGVACHFLPRGSFLTQGSNPGFLHCRQILYRLSHFHGSLPPCLILVYSPPTLC